MRRAADASIVVKEEEATKAADQYQELHAQEQAAQAQIKTLKEQLTGMRSSRFKANDLLTKYVLSLCQKLSNKQMHPCRIASALYLLQNGGH